jgi:hypothetical protein
VQRITEFGHRALRGRDFGPGRGLFLAGPREPQRIERGLVEMHD